jgi:hypothetical protein
MNARRWGRAAIVGMTGCVVGLASSSGCGSDGNDPFPSTSTSSGGSSGLSSSGASSGAASSSGASSSGGASSGGLDSSILDATFQYDAPLKPDSDACAETTVVATLKRLDMYVMLDRSGSMNYPYKEPSGQNQAAKGDCNVGQTLNPNSLWCKTINALSGYFKSTQATGDAAALQTFFTEPVTTACDGIAYSASAVPGGTTGYTTLPSSAFDAFLNGVKPDYNTPMEPAVKGITQFTGRAANQRVNRKTIGVLITDGVPGFCDLNATNISTLLQTHFNNTGIPTFVIGMTGAVFSTLETIATGGNAPLHGDNVGAITDACGNGPGPCRHFNIGEGNNNALATALEQVRGLAIACQYDMPVAPVGVVNPNDVNVEYLQNGALPAKKLTRVTNAGACVADGWYYDNNTTPTIIQLCPAQCTSVQADQNAKVNVSLGCLGG